MGGTTAKQDYLRYRDEAAAKKPEFDPIDQTPYKKFDDRSANSYLREASKPEASELLKKANEPAMKNPMRKDSMGVKIEPLSSYDAIDAGLGR